MGGALTVVTVTVTVVTVVIVTVVTVTVIFLMFYFSSLSLLHSGVAQWLMYILVHCVDLCVESLLRYYVNHFVSPSPICC